MVDNVEGGIGSARFICGVNRSTVHQYWKQLSFDVPIELSGVLRCKSYLRFDLQREKGSTKFFEKVLHASCSALRKKSLPVNIWVPGSAPSKPNIAFACPRTVSRKVPTFFRACMWMVRFIGFPFRLGIPWVAHVMYFFFLPRRCDLTHYSRCGQKFLSLAYMVFPANNTPGLR